MSKKIFLFQNLYNLHSKLLYYVIINFNIITNKIFHLNLICYHTYKRGNFDLTSVSSLSAVFDKIGTKGKQKYFLAIFVP